MLLALVAAQLLSARRDIVRGEEELARAQTALSQAQTEPARRHLARADGAFRGVRARTAGLVLRPVGAIPFLGSPVRGLAAGAAAGDQAVHAGQDLAGAVGSLTGGDGGLRLDDGDLGPVRWGLEDVAAALERAENRLREARRLVQGPAGAALPLVSGPANRAESRLAAAIAALDRAQSLTAVFSQLMRPEADTRLLLLAQDTLELRATGGFIGSFGVIRVSGGRIGLERYDSYEALPDPQPPMEPPPAMRPWLPRPWGLSNVNWWPDFPTTAAAARDAFARQEGGAVDGVVAITEHLLRDVVSVVGPVRVPGYADPVVAEGLEDRIVYEVELKEPPDVPRKRFLIELADLLFDRLFDLRADQVPPLSRALSRAASAGDLQFWLTDPHLQKALDGTVVAGQLPVAAGDFLALIDTNRSAGKANKDLTRDVTYRVRRSNDGEYLATLELRYRNEGRATVVNPWYFGHLRVYVPAGARLLKGTSAGVAATGRARDGPYQELATEVFVEPGRATTLRLEYVLPSDVVSGGRYRLTWVRQAGTPRDRLVAMVGGNEWELEADRRRLDVDADLDGGGIGQFVRSRWIVRALFD